MGCYLGIDGGGTRTVAWLADDDGKILARAESGPVQSSQSGTGARRTRNPEGLPHLLAGSGIAFATRARTHTPVLQRRLRRNLRGRPAARAPPAPRLDAPAHSRAPLPADFRRRHCAGRGGGGRPGIIVNAGTGSFAFARDDQGKLLRAGGWGIPFDDRGSGYDLGRKAVAAALQAFDGRGPQPRWTDRICQHLRLGDITEVVSQQLEPQQVAALFPW